MRDADLMAQQMCTGVAPSDRARKAQRHKNAVLRDVSSKDRTKSRKGQRDGDLPRVLPDL